jgi:hypothetical protein
VWVYASPDYMNCVKAIIIKQRAKTNKHKNCNVYETFRYKVHIFRFSSEIALYEPFLLFKVKENTSLKNVLLL